MECKDLTKRRGLVLAQVIRSVEITGYPLDEDVVLTIDYIRDNETGPRIHLLRRTKRGRKNNKMRQWPLGPIVRRDPKKDKDCIRGFQIYAKTLGVLVAALVSIIIDKMPSEFRPHT